MDVAHEVAAEAVAAGITAGTLRICKTCDRVHNANHIPTPTAAKRSTRAKRSTAARATVATNAFEQAALDLHTPQPEGRYALQVCEDPRDVCERGACSLHSTRAAGTLDEVRNAAGMWRHAWAVSPSGERIPLTGQPVPPAPEQAPVEDMPAGPMRIRVKMGIPRAELDRIKAKADADRAAFEADSARRRAAERAKYGPKDEQAPVEGTIVAHRGETLGCLPQHADHPDVIAALAVLTGNGSALPLRLATMRGDDIDGCAGAFGAVVEPRGDGRVALYWLVNGSRTGEDGAAHAVAVEILRKRIASAGWLVEGGPARRVVMAWRPEQQPAEAPEETEQAPRCGECDGRGCHWCYWTGENHLS
ncbi:hypothetical protein [Kitasatospora aureofaciens]|uniref:hypothetical protein n=1 Tax=Kitasatospora aureofaciens TaxID=1894 RepID=UPI00381154C9